LFCGCGACRRSARRPSSASARPPRHRLRQRSSGGNKRAPQPLQRVSSRPPPLARTLAAQAHCGGAGSPTPLLHERAAGVCVPLACTRRTPGWLRTCAVCLRGCAVCVPSLSRACAHALREDGCVLPGCIALACTWVLHQPSLARGEAGSCKVVHGQAGQSDLEPQLSPKKLCMGSRASERGKEQETNEELCRQWTHSLPQFKKRGPPQTPHDPPTQLARCCSSLSAAALSCPELGGHQRGFSCIREMPGLLWGIRPATLGSAWPQRREHAWRVAQCAYE